ncbi:MAG TPA: hypothetical protein VGN90_16675 [Pyrinomonadaceae bacterium]|jgi:hypothetical protein|nr:hypothetical protein [Pyrinomonadaceae bacterium]
MKTKPILSVSAVIEVGAGLALLVSPALAVSILIGAPFDSPADSIVGRVAGAALIALGLACWSARDDGLSRAAKGLVAAMLFYNVVAVLMIAGAGIFWHLFGIGLWPAVVLHAAMGIWCLARLLTERRSKSTT